MIAMQLPEKYKERCVFRKPEAAELLGLTEGQLDFLIRKKSIPSLKFGHRTIRIARVVIEKLLQEQALLDRLRENIKPHAGKNLSPKKRNFLYSRDLGICQLCNQPVAFEKMQVDHVIPKSLGGSNKVENLQISHRICNIKKSNNCDLYDFLVSKLYA